MPTDLCLPLLKYSHAIGVRADNSVPWTHLQAQDLFAIIKGKDAALKPDQQLSLRVVHGNTVLVCHLVTYLIFPWYTVGKDLLIY